MSAVLRLTHLIFLLSLLLNGTLVMLFLYNLNLSLLPIEFQYYHAVPKLRNMSSFSNDQQQYGNLNHVINVMLERIRQKSLNLDQEKDFIHSELDLLHHEIENLQMTIHERNLTEVKKKIAPVRIRGRGRSKIHQEITPKVKKDPKKTILFLSQDKHLVNELKKTLKGTLKTSLGPQQR